MLNLAKQLDTASKAFEFQITGEEPINGRAAWRLQAVPRPDYKGEYAFLRNIRGTLWIDKSDYQWVKVEAEAFDAISIGFFIARISKGVKIIFENVRVNDELWEPKHLSYSNVNARIALFKTFHGDQQYDFNEYRKVQDIAKAIAADDPCK